MKVASPNSLARLLQEQLAAQGDPSRAVTLSQLLEVHLSYAVVRGALGLAGKGEYDVALLGLLVDRSLLQVDPAVEAAAKRELEKAEPGLAFAGALADRLLRLRRDRDDAQGSNPAAGSLSVTEPDEAEQPPASLPSHEISDEPAETGEGLVASESTAAPRERETPRSESTAELAEGDDSVVATPEEAPAFEPLEPAEVAKPPAREPVEPSVSLPAACWTCSHELPARDGVRFCPHCGSDQEQPRCTACGEQVEHAWSFCPRCGRALET
ncbi:MAG: zinc ribbon domain-containing protein [Gemmatimonadota bacterium]|nr:zinc ribbon domain-containing protein [Gemmatimonadota bacterium]